MPKSVMPCISLVLYPTCWIQIIPRMKDWLTAMIPNINTWKYQSFWRQKCQISNMSMWIVLSINNSRCQCWQISVLIWSIELPINHASLKSDNITYVKMSYVLAILKHLAKAKYCQKSYSAKNILDLKKVSRKKTLAIQRDKQNKMYDSGKRSKKYQEEKQKKAKFPKNTKKYQFQHCC